MTKIKVAVNGAQGRMGMETVAAISRDPAFTLVAKIGHRDDLAQALKECQADVVVDFTTPDAVFQNTQIIIDSNAHPVIGTTGLSPDQITFLQAQCHGLQWGGIIAPNFSIGAVLLMKIGQMAATYFPDVEIIEAHHPQKKDAPSGTALKTAEMIAQGRESGHTLCNPVDSASRGLLSKQIPIHSVRLPGIIAQETLMMGGQGERLTLVHECINREAFMPGVLLACKKVVDLKELVNGLECIL